MRNKIASFFLSYSCNIGKIIFWTALALLSILYLERIFIIFSYEGQLAGIDNNFDYPVIRALAGYSIYPDPNAFPFAVNPYAPLFFIVCKNIASFIHISANETIAVYRITRSVALLADTATCVILFTILRVHGPCSKRRALIATSLFFSILCYLGYTFNRADSLFLFFYSLTFAMLLSKQMEGKLLQSVIVALLAVLTIFSKQNGIVLLALIPLWFISKRHIWQLLQFLFFTLLFSSLFLYYFESVYTDHTFILHVFHSLRNRIDPKWFYIYIFKPLANSYLIVPLSVSIIIALQTITGNKNHLSAKLGILFIVQLIFNVGLSFKWGSSLGYFNESYFIACLIITVFLEELPAPASPGIIDTVMVYLYPAFLIFTLHITAQLYLYFINDTTKNKAHFEEQAKVSRYLRMHIDGKKKYVMDLQSPDVSFFKNMLFKESAAPNFDAVDCCTLPDKIFNYTELISGLSNGDILFLIQNKEQSVKSIWNVSLSNYRLDTLFSSCAIYRFDSTAKK